MNANGHVGTSDVHPWIRLWARSFDVLLVAVPDVGTSDVHPWIRLWARSFDVLLVAVPVGSV